MRERKWNWNYMGTFERRWPSYTKQQTPKSEWMSGHHLEVHTRTISENVWRKFQAEILFIAQSIMADDAWRRPNLHSLEEVRIEIWLTPWKRLKHIAFHKAMHPTNIPTYSASPCMAEVLVGQPCDESEKSLRDVWTQRLGWNADNMWNVVRKSSR